MKISKVKIRNSLPNKLNLLLSLLLVSVCCSKNMLGQSPLSSSLALETGGSGIMAVSLSYEAFIGYKETQAFSNGLNLKLGVGYGSWPSNVTLVVVKAGVSHVWGKYNNWHTGIEISQPFGEASADFKSVIVYPFFGYRIGKGRVRGLISLGPVMWLFEEDNLLGGPIVVPFGSAGLSVQL